MKRENPFKTEAELVEAYISAANKNPWRDDTSKWVPYPETCGFDLVMVNDETGVQVGIEAKLSLNVKVLCQAISGVDGWRKQGPDYRAVLVPSAGVQLGLSGLARRLGLTVLCPYDHGYSSKPNWECRPELPSERIRTWKVDDDWFPWCPTERLKLPDYVPDVQAGKPSPVALTQWKIQAIKLAILLDRRGHVTRADMKALGLSPTFFCGPGGRLVPAHKEGRYQCYTAGRGMLDFKAQHPRNYDEIAADFDQWGADLMTPHTENLL
jgi:hypothetical protein